MKIHSSRISGTNGFPEYHFTLFLEDEDIKISGVNDDDLAYIRSKFNRTIRSKYDFNTEVANNNRLDSRKPAYFFYKNDFKKLVSRCLRAEDWINHVSEIINPDFVRYNKFVESIDSWIAYVQIPLARMINRDFFDRGFHKGAPERDFEIVMIDNKRQLVEIGGPGEYQEEVQVAQVVQETVPNAPQVSMFAAMATVPPTPNPTDEVPAPAHEETVGNGGTVKTGRPKNFPFLLSTTATIKKARIRYYEGQDYKYKHHNNRKYTESSVFKVFTALFHNVIIPNAIIARDGGVTVEQSDVFDALEYGMTHSKSPESIQAWRDFLKSRDKDWENKCIRWPFDLYVNGMITNFKTGEQKFGHRYTLKSYLEKENLARFVAKNNQHAHKTTPSLNRLINEFAKDRTIADLPLYQIVERFKVSKTTAQKFRKYIEERRENGFTDGDFSVTTR